MAVFIGGDTQKLEFDFSTKVAGSNFECPCTIWYSETPTNINPNNITHDKSTGWDNWYDNQQEQMDKIKNHDAQEIDTAVSGSEKGIAKFMVEVDLNTLCNSVYGGSHEDLKKDMRNIDVDVWASASGDNGGSVGHKCGVSVFNYDTSNEWIDLDSFKSTNSQISEIKYKTSNEGDSQIKLSPNNKIYILIASGYSSSETISSTLNLDYINVKLTLSRIPDKLLFTDLKGNNKKDYIDVNLGDEWSVLLKGISPGWDSKEWNYSDWGQISIEKDSNNALILFETDGELEKNFRIIAKNNNECTVLTSHFEEFRKFQCLNFLIQRKKDKITIYYLFNNKSVIKKEYVIKGNEIITGKGKLRFDSKLNSFIEHFNFFNYAIAKTDEEAKCILKGKNEIDINNTKLNELGKQFENPNLIPDFKDNNWIHLGDYVVSGDGKILTINSATDFQGSVIGIPILPNNRYKINCKLDNNTYITIGEQYNNMKILDDHRVFDNSEFYSGEFITGDKTNYIFLKCQSDSTGKITLSNLELKRLD